MNKCTVIYFVDFEKLGSFQEPLSKMFEIEYIHARDLNNGIDGYKSNKLLIICGAPISVHDSDKFSYLLKLKELIDFRLKERLQTIGICLGAQLIAHELGCEIVKAQKGPEFGWLDITDHEERKVKMFHFHGEEIIPNKYIEVIASSEKSKVQIFTVNNHALGFQCHPEFEANDIERWLVGHFSELSNHDVILDLLREDSKKYGFELKRWAIIFLLKWINKTKC